MKIIYYYQIYNKLITLNDNTQNEFIIPIKYLKEEKERTKIFKWYNVNKELRYSAIPLSWEQYQKKKDKLHTFFIQHIFQQIEDIIYVQY